MWMEAFAIFSVVLATHCPYCWKDLCQYQLLILHTYQQFGSHIWLAYDRASCENAVATNLVDWSEINKQLFNFHAAGTRGQQHSWSRTFEPSCSSHSTITCQSWDRGCCSPQMSIAILLIIAEAALGLIVLFIAQAWLLLSPGRQQRVNHPPCNSPSHSKSKLIWSELFQISLTSTLCCCFGQCWTLNVDQFCRELSRHHNPRLVASVLEGIHHGLKKGFSHLQPLRSAKRNKPSVYEHPTVTDESLMTRGLQHSSSSL